MEYVEFKIKVPKPTRKCANNLSPVKFYVLRGEETLYGHVDFR